MNEAADPSGDDLVGEGLEVRPPEHVPLATALPVGDETVPTTGPREEAEAGRVEGGQPMAPPQTPEPIQGEPIGADVVADGLEQQQPTHATAVFLGVGFAPWHRPRKQYLRRFQWRLEVERLLARLGEREDRVLSYLSLPGPDLLDVRDLQPLCAERRFALKFLGFKAGQNPEEAARLNLSLSGIRDLPGVHSRSEVIPDRLENIVEERSISYDRAEEYGPFDVINLDLCDSVAAPGHGARHYDVIRRLVAIQRRRSEPWLLLLTTRADRRSAAADDVQKFASLVAGNSVNERFRAGLERFCGGALAVAVAGGHQEGAGARNYDLGPLSPIQFLEFFGLGFGKWLLQLCLKNEPYCRMTLGPSFYYAIGCEPDMLSLGFIFEPGPPVAHDPNQLAVFVAPPEPVDEGGLATDLLGQISVAEDVDRILNDNRAVAERMIRETSELLESAGYPRDAYLRWVGQFHPGLV